MRAKKMLGVVLQIDGELARRGFILEQAKPHIGKPRLVAGDDVLLVAAKICERISWLATATPTTRYRFENRASSVDLPRRSAPVVSCRRSRRRARKIDAAGRLIGHPVDAAPERIVNILNLGRDERGVLLDIIGAGKAGRPRRRLQGRLPKYHVRQS